MPELPEVETVRNVLKKKVINKKIVDLKVNYEKIIAYPTLEQFKKEIINKVIIDIKRRGKWLIFDMDDYLLLSHLRMEGKFNLKNKNDEVNKHEHVIFIFDDETELRYQDTRKFGKMYLFKKDIAYKVKPLVELGLEPFDEKLDENYLKDKLKTKKLPIKTTLLDQKIIVGIGNIYADEILFLSKINPSKKAYLLNKQELNEIIVNTKKVLKQAIEDGGTTIRSYTSSENVHGNHQQNLFVHTKEICPNCNKIISKIKINGRTTYYCSNCQK